MIEMLLAGIAGVVIFAGFTALSWRRWKQGVNAAAQEIRSANGIVEESFVTIGGVPQWIQIRGEDRSNPVMLMVSGGPGNSLIPLGYEFLRGWEKDFTIVNWDQRGSGLTYIRNGRGAGEGLTIAQMIADTIEVSEYLCKHLGKKKIVLLGWSWGSILGAEAAHARPDLYSAYIGTGQFVNGQDNEAVGYVSLLARAETAKDEKTVAKLKQIGPPPYATNGKLLAERNLLRRYTPPLEREAFGKMIPLTLFAPGYSLLHAIEVAVRAPLFSIGKLWPSVMDYSVRHLGTEFKTPMFVINGIDDIQVPTTLARDWFAGIRAPQKEFITIPDAAHLSLATHPEEFLKIVDEKVRPLATAADS